MDAPLPALIILFGDFFGVSGILIAGRGEAPVTRRK